MQTITIDSKTFHLVTLPGHPGAADAEIAMNDTVTVVTSPFTRQEQAQEWPGGDFWDATITLPPMSKQTAAAWRAAMAELAGRANVFQLTDPAAYPVVNPALGAPKVLTTAMNNLPMTKLLATNGWTPNTQRLLVPGQQFQLGYRLYMVTQPVNADAGGNATLNIWPSLRETPGNGTALVFAKPAGLFRLAGNRRSVHWSPAQLTTLSIKCVEAR